MHSLKCLLENLMLSLFAKYITAGNKTILGEVRDDSRGKTYIKCMQSDLHPSKHTTWRQHCCNVVYLLG